LWRREVDSGFWWERESFEDFGVYGMIILKWIFSKWD
jgi:hypothetical protein